MSRRGWHIARRGRGVILSRRPGAAADAPGIWAETRLAVGGCRGARSDLRLGVLAHEIRKDVWRALRDLRGFSPIIEIQPCEEEPGLCVRAGGAVAPRPPAVLHAALGAVLEDAPRRARWIAHATRRQQ